jgi:hypothetical protein
VLASSGAIDSGLLGTLGALCLVILTLAFWRRSQQGRSTAREVTREQRARLRDQEQLRQAMQELLAQLEETATRVDAQVGTRITKLEELLRQADERLVTEVGRAGGVRETCHDQCPRVCELADQGKTPIAIAEALNMPVGEVELMLDVRRLSSVGPPRPT